MVGGGCFVAQGQASPSPAGSARARLANGVAPRNDGYAKAIWWSSSRALSSVEPV